MPVALIDLIAAHHVKEAILLALLKRNQTKKGSRITVSLFNAAVASLANQATNWLVAGHIPQRTGSLHPNIAPYGEIFKTKDKHLVTFAIGSDTQFQSLCKLLGLENISSDKKYLSNQARVKNRKKLFGLLNKEVAKRTLASLQKETTLNLIPFAKIRNLKEVFELRDARKLLFTTKAGQKVVRSAIADIR